MIIPLLLKHKMHVARPIRMAMQLLQQPPHRPIVGDRIGHGGNSLEPEDTLFIRAHNTAPIGFLTPRILHIVMARGVRLPDIDLDVLDGPPLCVAQSAHDQQGLAGGIMGQRLAGGHLFGVVGVEWAEHGAFRGARGFGVVD